MPISSYEGDEMDELWGQIATTVRGMWVYRRLAMALAWLVAVVGVAVVLMMPDHYQAAARVYVDTQSILRPLMVGIAVQPNIEQQVGMLSRTLLSRPTIERLIRTADLDLGAQSKAANEAMVDKVTQSISIKTTGRDNLYTLSYTDQNPVVAQRVVQTLLTIFVESSLGATRQDSDSARRFLDNQIKSYVQAAQYRAAIAKRLGLGRACRRSRQSAEPSAPGAARGRQRTDGGQPPTGGVAFLAAPARIGAVRSRGGGANA